MVEETARKLEGEMEIAVREFLERIRTIHAGRAETAIVEDIEVSYYGRGVKLRELASITAPEPTLIVISPYDKNALGDIELAIRNAQIGLNPVNDGHLIRLAIPPLSAERRDDLIRLIERWAEDTRVRLRQLRHDAWEKIQDAEMAGKITEDDKYRGEERLNEIIRRFQDRIAEAVSSKENELRTV